MTKLLTPILAKGVTIVLMISLLLISAFLQSATGSSSHKPMQLQSVQICCAWSDQLKEGILTYHIGVGNPAIQQAFNQAVGEWNSKLTGLRLVEIKDNNLSADIDVHFNTKALRISGGGGKGHLIAAAAGKTVRMVEPGQTIIDFNNDGLINHITMTISTSAFGSSFDMARIEQIAKHEIGHALGLGHANFISDLMSPILTVKTKGSVSQCDVNAVFQANQWKLVELNNSPHIPPVNEMSC